MGKTRLTQDLLTSREAPGPGQGRSTEKGHAGGLAEPPRFFREKVSMGFASCQKLPKKAFSLLPGKRVLKFKDELAS